MLAILAIPHSNANSECVFSAVRHVDTVFRSKMDMALMEPLIVVKQHMVIRNDTCYTHKFTLEFLSRAKSATYQGLQKAETQTEEEIPMEDVSGRVLKILDVISVAEKQIFR